MQPHGVHRVGYFTDLKTRALLSHPQMKRTSPQERLLVSKPQRGGLFRRESAGLEEERLAHTLGSCSTHHPQRGLQLLPVMVFLDFLKTQDLGN